MSRTVILDNGAHRMKVGYAGDAKPSFIPNCVVKSKSDRKRIYVADELDECVDKSALFFVLPFERGYLMNWDVELQIWDRVFGKNGLNVDFQESRLLLTDPSDIAKAVRDVSAEIAFETYQYQSFLRTSAPSCVAYSNLVENEKILENSCCLVVDSGHSFTHIVPYIDGKIVQRGIVRIDVGGKVLTNQLKEWISYRQLNVLEETYVMNQCKEDVCFVSTDLQTDMKRLGIKGEFSLRRDYLLPDFVNSTRGCMVTPSQSHVTTDVDAVDERAKISVGVERIATPEILFHPSDVEIAQMGIVEAIHYSLNQLPEEVRYLLLKNITLIGGNTLFQGYKERIEKDLRPLIADHFDFRLNAPVDAIGHAWHCASKLTDGSSDGSVIREFSSKFVSRTEYAESGANICRAKFNNYYGAANL